MGEDYLYGAVDQFRVFGDEIFAKAFVADGPVIPLRWRIRFTISALRAHAERKIR
jgi:hypothetical protein